MNMSSLLRSRLSKRSSDANKPSDSLSLSINESGDSDEEPKKGNATSFLFRYRALIILLAFTLFWHSIFTKPDASNLTKGIGAKSSSSVEKAPFGGIIYGAKSKGEDTARLVKEAIQTGFRHIATGGFHAEYNETGVGQGWKQSGIPRNELYLQTLFVSQTTNNYGADNCRLDNVCPHLSGLPLEEQVKLSIQSSLHNLQTDYIDAVLVHNFRAKLQPYEETLTAWRVLEGYVDKGVVRHLGIVSVHDKDFLTKLHNDARIKPTIIQNRFHSNRGYDVGLRPLFKELGFKQHQLFWVLTGSAGGTKNNPAVKELAEKKGVSPQVLLYSFTMEIESAPLIGCKSIDHMKEDVDALVKNRLKWDKDELVTMAGAVNKNLIPQVNTN